MCGSNCPAHPFTTGSLPLSYSTNPGVNDVAYRGRLHLEQARYWGHGVAEEGEEGRPALGESVEGGGSGELCGP